MVVFDPMFTEGIDGRCPRRDCHQARDTTTGHTYSVIIKYYGSNLTIDMYDETADGACPRGRLLQLHLD
jgi:hypothetical protein